jgi:beta-lactamase class D
MYEAFRISDVPYFQEVARRIGKDTMQHWLDTLAYGSTKIKTQIDSFWLDGSLKITPDEQLGLVKQLYFYQLPFHKRNQQLVKTAMLMEDKPEYKLSYKTGWGTDSSGRQIGWVTGWIEENGHPYFFVLNLSTAEKNSNMPIVRMQILNGILEQLGFKKGNK